MPKTSNRTPVQVELDATPVQVARGLRHLPGLVFLDSSSTDSATPGEFRMDAAVSLIAARPNGTLTGDIFSETDRDGLRRCISRYRAHLPDLGFPCGGLVGAIDYDGRFEFGVYPEMLVYDHSADSWFEIGGLSGRIDCGAELDPVSSPGFEFSGAMNRERFCRMVAGAQEYISAGDIYQVNLSHRLHAPWPAGSDPFSLYERFRSVTPSPFAAFLELDRRTVLSTSPEQFLNIAGSRILTRPIKGTRPRFRDRARDEKSAYDLKTSPKEIAELIMITDLERNDLGQICEYGTVEASELLKLERFEQVFHLVSTVEGTLRPDIDAVAALAACFPGGSITGAPKKRAREIIAELEPEERGLYTGSVGIFGFNGESRFNIAIRTALVEDGELHFHVGAGIVADSDPASEWEETLHKAAGILRASRADDFDPR